MGDEYPQNKFVFVRVTSLATFLVRISMDEHLTLPNVCVVVFSYNISNKCNKVYK